MLACGGACLSTHIYTNTHYTGIPLFFKRKISGSFDIRSTENAIRACKVSLPDAYTFDSAYEYPVRVIRGLLTKDTRARMRFGRALYEEGVN
jgi:hypothetical protein